MAARRRLLLAVLVLALLWALAALLRSLSSFWVVFWLLLLWAYATGQ